MKRSYWTFGRAIRALSGLPLARYKQRTRESEGDGFPAQRQPPPRPPLRAADKEAPSYQYMVMGSGEPYDK
jgi:hypothetical protein